MSTLQVPIHLTASEWENKRRAWRCELLRFPGSQVQSLRIPNSNGLGEKLSDEYYRIDGDLVRWLRDQPPPGCAITLEVQLPLASIVGADEKQFEREIAKLQAAKESEIANIKGKWTFAAACLSALSATLTAIASALLHGAR